MDVTKTSSNDKVAMTLEDHTHNIQEEFDEFPDKENLRPIVIPKSLNRNIVISLEGNIGAGKSTFLRVLKSYFGEENIEFIPEPVHYWTNCNGQNLLDAFYSDSKRYAYMFQSFALVTRLMEQAKPQKKLIRILERSGLSDHCFAENCHAAGLMNEIEYAAYETWYKYLITQMPGGPNGLVYLRTSPEVCYKRMEKRSRQEESAVPLDYLRQIHQRHETWLPSTTKKDKVCQLPFVTLNGDLEFETSDVNQKILIQAVLNLIDQLH